MPELTCEQKYDAMATLGETCIKKSTTGLWYVSQRGVERKEGGILSGGGDWKLTIEDAINARWTWLTDTKYYIVINAMDKDRRRALQWNGFMWKDVQE